MTEPQFGEPARPSVRPATLWHFPEPERMELSNGLGVWLFNLPGQHVISLEMCLDAPLCHEPRALEGVATLALRCADEGTPTHPGVQLAEAIEDAGAVFDGAAHASATSCGMEVPATRFGDALNLLAEIVRTPSYDEPDVHRHVALRQAELAQRLADPAACASDGLRQAIFDPSCRDARPAGGRGSTVQGISPEDLHAWHDRWWRPAAATLILAGQLPAEAAQVVMQAFGDWRPTPADPPIHQPARAREGERLVWVIDRPRAVQTEIRIGAFGPDRGAPDWAALQVGTAALGGVFGSRLNRVLREERGYTYGAHLGCLPLRRGGNLLMSTSCRTDVAAQAITTSLELLDVRPAPLTSIETADAINFLLGVAPLRYDTASPIALQASAMAAAGLTCEWINQHYARLASVDADQATQALVRHINPSRLHIVACGPADRLLPDLRRAGLNPEVVEPDL